MANVICSGGTILPPNRAPTLVKAIAQITTAQAIREMAVHFIGNSYGALGGEENIAHSSTQNRSQLNQSSE